MLRTRWTKGLALLVIPMTMLVAGSGVSWADTGEDVCKSELLSPVPLSLCAG